MTGVLEFKPKTDAFILRLNDLLKINLSHAIKLLKIYR